MATTVGRLSLPLMIGAALAAISGPVAAQPAVTAEELVKGVSIALGTLPLDQCQPMDTSDNGQVTVDDLVAAVDVALTECLAL
jgi:hypothetical protein